MFYIWCINPEGKKALVMWDEDPQEAVRLALWYGRTYKCEMFILDYRYEGQHDPQN